jgi:hypothetical protein
MPIVPDFHSVNESLKLEENRVYHNNSICAQGREIPEQERRAGTGGYRLCARCKEYQDAGRLAE